MTVMARQQDMVLLKAAGLGIAGTLLFAALYPATLQPSEPAWKALRQDINLDGKKETLSYRVQHSALLSLSEFRGGKSLDWHFTLQDGASGEIAKTFTIKRAKNVVMGFQEGAIKDTPNPLIDTYPDILFQVDGRPDYALTWLRGQYRLYQVHVVETGGDLR